MVSSRDRGTVPQDISVDEALAGEALVEAEAGSLRAFPEAALPAGAPERFAALWAARPLWAATDIEPYVAGLQVLPAILPLSAGSTPVPVCLSGFGETHGIVHWRSTETAY